MSRPLNPNALEFTPAAVATSINLPAAGGAGRPSPVSAPTKNLSNAQKQFFAALKKANTNAKEKAAAAAAAAEEEKVRRELDFKALPMIPDDKASRELVLNTHVIMNNDDMKLLSGMISAQAKMLYTTDSTSGKIKKNFVFVISSHGTSTRDIGYNSRIVLNKEKGNQEIVAYGAHKSTLLCDLGVQTTICKLWAEDKELGVREGIIDKREWYSNQRDEAFPYDYILQPTEDKTGRFLKTGVVLCNLPRNTIMLSFDDFPKSILLSQVYDLIQLFVDIYCGGVWDSVRIKTHLLFCRASAIETGENMPNVFSLTGRNIKAVGGYRKSNTRRRIRVRRTQRR